VPPSGPENPPNTPEGIAKWAESGGGSTKKPEVPQGAPEPGEPEAEKVKDAEGGGKVSKVSKAVLDQRVNFVAKLWRDGHPTAEILRKVAEEALQEKAQWEAYVRGSRIIPPVLVWGKQGPPAQRTTERYIHLTKKLYEATAKTAKKEAELWYGKQLARLEAGYADAKEAKDGVTALRYLREINQLMALYGPVKVGIGGIEDAPPVKQQVVPFAPHTEEGVISILGELAEKARKRMQEQEDGDGGSVDAAKTA
jgi:hypothetical protein